MTNTDTAPTALETLAANLRTRAGGMVRAWGSSPIRGGYYYVTRTGGMVRLYEDDTTVCLRATNEVGVIYAELTFAGSLPLEVIVTAAALELIRELDAR